MNSNTFNEAETIFLLRAPVISDNQPQREVPSLLH